MTSFFPLTITACCAYVIIGTLYVFPIYLTDLKNQFDLTQVQMNWLGSGLYLASVVLGVPLGQFLIEYVGVKRSSPFGALFATAGYCLFYLTVKKIIAESFVLLFMYSLFAGLCVGIFFNLLLTAALTEVAADRGHFIVNITSAAFAIGGAFMCIVYLYALKNAENVFLFMCISHGVMGIVTTVSIAIFYNPPAPTMEDLDLNTPLVAAENGLQLQLQKKETTTEYLKSLFGSVRTLLAILIMIIKVGIGTTFTTNIGSLSDTFAPADDPDYSARMVTIFAFSQMAGRLLLVFLSTEKFLRFVLGKHYQPDPSKPKANPTMFFIFCIAVAYTVIFAVSIINISASNLVAITAAFGIFYGAMWSVSASLVYYTSRPDHSLTFSILIPFGGVGTMGLNFIAGSVYDSNIGTSGNLCFGSECYRKAWYILTALSTVMALSALALQFLWRNKDRSYLPQLDHAH